MTTYAPDVQDTVSTPTAATVVSVVVTGPSTQDLSPLLKAVAAQSVTADLVIVLDCTVDGDAAGEVEGHPELNARVVRAAPGADTRAAVSALVADPDILPSDALVWLLPAGVVPQSEALGLLVAAHRRSAAVVAAGPKLLDASDPTLLRSMGIQSTVAGRLVEDPAPGTRDQRQYDTRRDVLAVPLAGALLRTDAVRALKGWEPSFGDVGADLDLGWRLHLRGGRVELVPAARVRAAQGLGRATADTGARRRAARRVALARAAWWAAPFLALWLVLGSVLSGLTLLLLKRPRAAAAELGDLLALDPVRWVVVKVRRPAPVRVGRRHLTALFVPAAELRRRVTDEVSESLFPGRGPDQEVDRDADRPSTLVRVATNPGLLAMLATAAVVAVAARSLGTQVLAGLRGGLVGGELTGGRADAAALWAAWSDGWSGAGLGHAGSGSPALALLAAVTWVVEHVPGTGSLTSTMGATTAGLLVLTPLAACVSAYLSARVLTSRRWLRAAAAVAWATVGAAGPAYAAGRLGALVALVLIPLVLAGLALLARPDGTATAAWATTLALLVLTAFAPTVAAALLAVALLLALGAPARGARLRALTPLLAVPCGTLLWWPGLFDDWHPLLVGQGLASWGGPAVQPWRLAVLDTGEVGAASFWYAVPVVVLGVLGLVRGRSWRSMTTVLAVLALGGLALALAAGRLQITPVPTVLGQGVVTPWAGAGLLVLTAALLAAAVLGLDGLAGDGRRPTRRKAQVAARTVTALLAAGLAGAAAAGLVLATLGTLLSPWVEARPAVAVEHADGPLAGRTLFVQETPVGPGFRLVGRESDGPTRTLPRTDQGAGLAETVSGLLDGSAPQTSADALRGLAVGFVAVEAGLGDDITRRLDATNGLTRLAARNGWAIWRVAAVADGVQTPIGPPRVSITGPSGVRPVDVTGQSAATVTQVRAQPGDVLRVSEGAGWANAASVTLDGTALDPTADNTCALPSGGRLEIDVRRGPSWLPLLQLGGLVALLFLAVPFGSRASRTRGRTA